MPQAIDGKERNRRFAHGRRLEDSRARWKARAIRAEWVERCAVEREHERALRACLFAIEKNLKWISKCFAVVKEKKMCGRLRADRAGYHAERDQLGDELREVMKRKTNAIRVLEARGYDTD